MKLKAKPGNDGIIEKFTAQSSKTAKYAKTTVKKREASELRTKESNIDGSSVSNNGGAAGNAITVTSQNADGSGQIAEKSGTAGSNV
jgi:hypothetical protein